MESTVEVAPMAVEQKNPVALLWPRAAGWLLVLLVAWLYHSILYRLAVQWWGDPNFSHGFFVPAFSVFVLWQSRNRLTKVRISPSWTGLPIVILALIMLVFGELGVELFTSRSSFIILLAGLIILFRGWPLFRAVLFPWAFLFLMVPLPAIILQHFTFPLQILASKLATWSLQAVGIPALREGNQIYLPHITLDVAEACSGIRSLVSLITLAIIYGYLMDDRKSVRVALVCAAVPIAITANVFRIFVTGLVGQWNPDLAKGFYHEFQGWLIFLAALPLLFGLHRLINLIWKPSPTAAPPTPPVADIPQARAQAKPPSPARFAVVAFLMLTVAAVQHAWGDEVPLPPRQPLSSLPMQFDKWSGRDVPLDDETVKILGHGEFLQRDYETDSDQQPEVELFAAYYPTQKFGDSIHAPLHCIIGAGYTPVQRQVAQLDGPRGAFAVNRWVAVKGLDRSLILYWYQAHGREVTSEYWEKYYLISDSIHLHRSDGALIRLSTAMNKGESADAAQARIMQLGNQVIPLLDNSIPR